MGLLDELEAKDPAYQPGAWGAGPRRLLVCCPTGCNRELYEADNGMRCVIHGHFTWTQIMQADTDD